MDWREFITHMYEDVVNAKSQSVDVSLDFADFVRDDFNNFFLNKQSFLDKAALTLSQVGVYRPNTVNAEAEFNLLLRSMKKRFDLGVPFCEAIDTTYREVESLVDESTDRFTDSVANFGNSVRYYIEEFVLEVFNSDDDFCTAVNNVATDSWGFDMTTDSAAVYGHVQTGIKLAAAAFANDTANVQTFASELFNNLEFSSFADQTVDIDFKAVIRTAFTNINMGSANFAFINGDDQKSLSDNFFARVGTMINSFNNIPDIAATCSAQPENVKAIFVSFVTDTQVFPQGFCDANWSEQICSTFNSIVDKYNNMKLEFDLFESETLADIANKVSSKVDKVVSGLSAKVGLLQKGRQLAKEVVINFNEARTRLAPLDKVKAAFTQVGPKLVTFIADVAQLRVDCENENNAAVAAGNPAVYDFNGEAWTMISALLQEANDWNTNGAGRKRRSVKSRRRRSFNDLDYNDPEDRHILRQHVPFFNEPNCGEGAFFDDYSRHGKWRMNNSPLYKTAGGYDDTEFESSLRVWSTNEVPAIRYFAGKRFPGCSCPHGQIYFNGKCQNNVPGCLFTHNNEQIFIKRGHRYHYDCNTEFYCKDNGEHLTKTVDCPSEYCREDKFTGNTYCEWLTLEPCLANGLDIIAMPLFDQSSFNGAVYFDQFNKQFGKNSNFDFKLLYSNKGDVKEASTFNIDNWYGMYSTTDLLNLFVEAEGRFANSMSRIKIAYLQIDATVLAKFDEKVVAIMQRMKNMGVKVFIDEIQDIPLIFKSILDADRIQKIDLNNDSDVNDRMDRAAKFCSTNECHYNNGGCSHECRWNQYERAVCLCPTGYVLDNDGKTCLPTDVTCEITSQMESDYKAWLAEMEQWNNF